MDLIQSRDHKGFSLKMILLLEESFQKTSSKKDIFMTPVKPSKMPSKILQKRIELSINGSQKVLSAKSSSKIRSQMNSRIVSSKNSEMLKKNSEKNVSFFQKFLMTKGHLGSQKWTKDMTESFVGIRHGMSVFDGENTKIACSRVFNFLKTYQKRQGRNKKLDILFVNTSEQYRHLVKMVARASHQRYINEKWVAGTLTNWSQISQSYSLFGRFDLFFGNFLKKRKIHLPLYEKTRRIYSGLLPRGTDPGFNGNKKIQKFSESVMTDSLISDENLPSSQTLFTDGLPDILVVINPEENQNVVHEANLLKIPVIALADSQTKISGIDYMIPGNIQSIEFVYWCLHLITILLQKFQKRT